LKKKEENLKDNKEETKKLISDLGAELWPCTVCGIYSVLTFMWCSKCREEHKEIFERKYKLITGFDIGDKK
jgi:hypothetical protein